MSSRFVADGSDRYEGALARGRQPGVDVEQIKADVRTEFLPRLKSAGWWGRWRLRRAMRAEAARRAAEAGQGADPVEPSPGSLW